MQKQVRTIGRSNSSTRSGHRSFVTGCASNAIRVNLPAGPGGVLVVLDAGRRWWSTCRSMTERPPADPSRLAAVLVIHGSPAAGRALPVMSPVHRAGKHEGECRNSDRAPGCEESGLRSSRSTNGAWRPADSVPLSTLGTRTSFASRAVRRAQPLGRTGMRFLAAREKAAGGRPEGS